MRGKLGGGTFFKKTDPLLRRSGDQLGLVPRTEELNQKSATAVARGRGGRSRLPSRIFEKLNGSSPSWSLDFCHFAAPWATRESLTGGHVKMMLAYGHGLSYDHQGFRPFSPDHRKAAGPAGPAVARVEVHCKLQTVPSCSLATASTAVMEVVGLISSATTRERGCGSSRSYGLQAHP